MCPPWDGFRHCPQHQDLWLEAPESAGWLHGGPVFRVHHHDCGGGADPTGVVNDKPSGVGPVPSIRSQLSEGRVCLLTVECFVKVVDWSWQLMTAAVNPKHDEESGNPPISMHMNPNHFCGNALLLKGAHILACPSKAEFE